MCYRLVCFLVLKLSANDVITFLNVNNDLFMSIDSFWARPVLPVRAERSLPARSTSWSLALITLSIYWLSMISRLIVKSAWDRLDAWFRLWEATTLFLIPLLKSNKA